MFLNFVYTRNLLKWNFKQKQSNQLLQVKRTINLFYFKNDAIIIIIIHSLELFTSALAVGFSLESEWQQVSSSLQDFS